MLSPNAMNLVAVSSGWRVTLTAKLQAAVRWSASRAVQVTVVDPTANDDPLAGEHEEVTGAVPPVTVGAG
jgi:hypothetical protein